MTNKQFVIEKPRPVRDALIAIAIGGVAIIVIDYLFSGMVLLLGPILAAVVKYLFVRR